LEDQDFDGYRNLFGYLPSRHKEVALHHRPSNLVASEFTLLSKVASLSNTDIGERRGSLLGESFTTSNALTADKVRVEATTGEHLHVLEFQIHSTSGSNVAKQGSASQSSTWGNLAAAKAIDGSNSTSSHTADSNAWWGVQLTEAVEVEQLVILNRYCQGVADSLGCLCCHSEARITLYNNNVSVGTRQLGNTCGELVVSESFSA
jgi:hypothetical protein